ncbi:MAG: PIN domain-containing protein [Armatimonadota bacterium]|nr:PIN domain-containing protein [Armatimonadota bacterium]MDR5703736.1 PIN domain-containing protein [Armatimonadota bacterium]MDR7434996.1 PIN domain-containing protein [Armatimonadota bacterium]
MRQILVDTGPLVALLDAGDEDHERCVEVAKRLRAELITTWPVMTEALYLLAGVPEGQDALLGKVETGELQVAELTIEDVPVVRLLMRKYQDLPMDFADASLVRVAQRDGLGTIFTLDRRDFQVYRRDGRRAFRLLP